MPFPISFPIFKTQWQRLNLSYRLLIPLLIPMTCIVASVGTHNWLTQGVIESEQYVQRTQDVLQINQEILISLLNAETSVRGYYINPQADFLEFYQVASNNLPDLLSRLQYLLRNNSLQLERSQELAQLSQQRLMQFQQVLRSINNLRRENPPTRQNQLLRQGKTKMDRIRLIIEQLEQEEKRSLIIRKQTLISQLGVQTTILWGSLIISALGTAIAIVLFIKLVEELQERGRYLYESKNLAKTVVASVLDSVIILDGQDLIESFNDAAVRMFGYTSAEVIGKDWRLLLAPTPDLIEANYDTGKHRQGSFFPIEVSFSEISVNHRQIVIIRDMTERQQTVAKLQARSDELARLNKSLSMTNWLLAERNNDLDQFAYVASHDLKAPLRAISNLSEWIEEDLMGEISIENQAQMQLLRRRVHRMDALLDGLLEYSRVGRVPTQVESIDVEELLAEILDTLEPAETFKFDIMSMPTLNGRKLLLKQVFTNLIDNAIKHHPSQSGLVKISAIDLGGDRYEFAVTDDGKGINPQFHKRIFNVFQTLQARDVKESTGIGLAIVKKIVESEGGQIWLKSELGKGASFHFTWLNLPIERLS